MNYQDLQKKVETAKKYGYSEEEINSFIAKKAGIQQQNYSSPVPEKPSMFKSVAKSVGNFFAPNVTSIVQDVGASNRTGSYVSSMEDRAKRLNELTALIRNEQDPFKKATYVNESRKLAQSDRPEEPGFSNQTLKATEAGKTGNIGDYVGRGLKTGLEVGSYFIPVGKGIKAATGLGAVGGAMRSLSADDATLGSVVGGTLTGGVVGGGMAIAGKAIGGLKNLGKGMKDAVEEKAAMSISKASPTQFRKAVEEHGVDLNGLIAKYYPSGSNYDDLLGPIAQRGKGGVLGNTMKKAEETIQNTVNTAGRNYRIPVDDVVSALNNEVKQLQQIPGNEASVSALNEFINQTKKLYKNGITAKQLLNIKRAADSKFGQAVINEEAGSVAAQGQKTLANWSRGMLKKLFPEIKDALDTQSDMYTLQSVLNHARSITKTQGSKIRNGAFQNATDFLNPKAYYDAAMSNPTIASKFLNRGGVPASPKLAFSGNKVTDVLGTMGRNLPIQTATGMVIGQGNPQQKQYGNNTSNSGYYNKAGNNVYGNVNQSTKSISPQAEQGQIISKNQYEITKQEADYLIAQDMAKTGGKNFEKIKALYEWSNPEPNKEQTQKSQVSNVVDQLQQLYMPDDGESLSLGKITVGLKGLGAKAGMIGKKAFDQDYVNRLESYNQMRAVAVGIINQARGAGVLNDGEYQTLIANMPNENTPEQVAKNYFLNVKKMLQAAPQTVTDYSSPSTVF